MSRNLYDLERCFLERLLPVIHGLRNGGIDMRPFFALRDPWEQARLWRQSRTRTTIVAAYERLQEQGAPWLANVLTDVGPQYGRDVTGALPGFSWHQWGRAADFYWHVKGRAEWSTRRLVDGVNGYQELADAVEKAGLTSGGRWKRRKDYPHVQQSPLEVREHHTVEAVDQLMRERFSGDYRARNAGLKP